MRLVSRAISSAIDCRIVPQVLEPNGSENLLPEKGFESDAVALDLVVAFLKIRLGDKAERSEFGLQKIVAELFAFPRPLPTRLKERDPEELFGASADALGDQTLHRLAQGVLHGLGVSQ